MREVLARLRAGELTIEEALAEIRRTQLLELGGRARVDLGRVGRRGLPEIVLAEGRLIILTEHGDLVLVHADPESYQELARASALSRPARCPIALANGKLYGRDAKKLVCWNLKK